jgi:hypothetical protein
LVTADGRAVTRAGGGGHRNRTKGNSVRVERFFLQGGP